MTIRTDTFFPAPYICSFHATTGPEKILTVSTSVPHGMGERTVFTSMCIPQVIEALLEDDECRQLMIVKMLEWMMSDDEETIDA